MSVQFDTDGEFFYLSATPNATTFTMAAWVRKDATAADFWIGPDADAGSGLNKYKVSNGINSNERMEIFSGTTAQNCSDDWPTNAWRYVVLSRSGSDPNGVLQLRWLETGAATLEGPAQLTGLSALIPTVFGINTSRGSAANGAASATGRLTIAFIKVWSTVELNDTDALAERLYRNIQTNTANDWACWTFGNDSGFPLLTDSSGNGRTLSQVGTAPYSADEPSDILGDDPGGGGGTVEPSRGMARGLMRGIGRGLANASAMVKDGHLWRPRERRLVMPVLLPAGV